MSAIFRDPKEYSGQDFKPTWKKKPNNSFFFLSKTFKYVYAAAKMVWRNDHFFKELTVPWTSLQDFLVGSIQKKGITYKPLKMVSREK